MKIFNGRVARHWQNVIKNIGSRMLLGFFFFKKSKRCLMKLIISYRVSFKLIRWLLIKNKHGIGLEKITFNALNAITYQYHYSDMYNKHSWKKSHRKYVYSLRVRSIIFIYSMCIFLYFYHVGRIFLYDWIGRIKLRSCE